MLLLTSRRKTGLSSGKIKITFWIALKETFIVIKNNAPWMFWMACCVLVFSYLAQAVYVSTLRADPKQLESGWGVTPDYQKSRQAKRAVTQVVRSLTYEV